MIRFRRDYSRFAAIAILLLALIIPAAAQAHPHIFVEHHMQVLFDQSGVTGLRWTWSFDEMYSSTLRSDYTDTPKGPITPKDVLSLHDQHFAPVTKKHFFATVTINGEPITLDRFTDFDAKFVDDKAVYSFTVPLTGAKPAAKNTLEITLFDPEYYIDFELTAQDPVKAIGGEKLGARCTNTTISRDTIGWGQVDTDLVSCTYTGSAS